MRRTLRRAGWTPVLLAVAGVLGFVAAAFPTDPMGVPLTTHGLIHNLGGILTFMLYAAVMLTSGFAFGKSSDWKPFRRVTTCNDGTGWLAMLGREAGQGPPPWCCVASSRLMPAV
jgi:uncharacterized protein DUF998